MMAGPCRRGPAGPAPAFVLALALGLVPLPAPAQEAPAEEFPLPEGFAGGFREVDGIRLHYVTGGSGPLAMLVHGFGQTWYEWHQLMPLLARDFTVVAVDLPGLGLSEVPGSYAGQDVAPLLHGLAQGFSPEAPFDLVAHDIGIWNTYPALVENQEDYRRVVYMEAPIPDDSIYEYPAFTPEGPSPVWHFSFFTAENGLAETLIEGQERVFLDYFILSQAGNPAVFTPELLDLYARSYAKPGTFANAFGYYRALNETERRNEPLAATMIDLPILVITGEGVGGSGAWQAEQMRLYATDVTGEVLPGCGHWLPEECADQVNRLVTGFLTRP